MSAETVLRNIYSYLEVLEAAHTQVVSNWDTTALLNAFKWAAYCAQIFTQSKGKAYASDLDERVQMLNRRPWSLGGMWIKLNLLEHSEDLLTKALLQNQHLSSHLYDQVVKSCLTRGQHHLIQSCFKMSQIKSAVKIVDIIKNGWTRDSHPDEECSSTQPSIVQPLPEESLQVQGRLLHNYMKKTLRSAGESTRVVNVLEGKLKEIVDQEHGLEILLHSILVNDVSAGSQTRQTKRSLPDPDSLILTYILQIAKSDCRIWDVSKPLLSKVAASSFIFFTSYMRHLVEATNTMVLMPVAPPGSPTWRCPPGVTGLPYKEIVQHFVHLRSSKPYLSSVVKKSLDRLADTGQSLAWKAIIKDST